jgi:dCTP deaminase
MLKHSEIASRLRNEGSRAEDPFYIIPCPPALDPTEQNVGATGELPNGAASIDLRLGTWFLASRKTHVPLLEIARPFASEQRLKLAIREVGLDKTQGQRLAELLVTKSRDNEIATSHHVRFGLDFILHPRSFVLGVTLEWLRLPADLGGYVIGRSSWGRRGLVIATATGVHPGFTGCLTLELANLGDIPIAIRPGMTIGQLFLHDIHAPDGDRSVDLSSFVCKRRPRLGHPIPDEIALKLASVES